MNKLPSFVKNFLLAVPVLAAAALAAAHLGDTEGRGWVLLPYAGRGWELLYGINEPGISYSMPLLSLLMTLADFAPARLLAAVSASLFLIVLLAWNLGRARAGEYGGLVYALAAAAVSLALPAPHDPEQVFFTLLILLWLNLEAAREAAPGLPASLLSGLALGVTLLTRSTLFLLPPLLAALHLAGARPRKALLKEAALFLLGAYVLLVPWAQLNHFVYGKFVPFEYGRADSNVITGVLGSVYTMEGNPRALAGISRDENALAWAAQRVAQRPLAYAASTAKRAWHILLVFPLLALLAAAALLYLRRSAPAGGTALVLYFIAVHSLMSIELRYFYPLAYLLGLLAAAGLCGALKLAVPPPGTGLTAARLALLPALLAALAADWVVLAYPSKAAGLDCLSGVEAALAKKPGHPWLLYKKGEYLVTRLRTEEGLAALRESVRFSGDRLYSNAGDILDIMDSPAPEKVRAEFTGSYFGTGLLAGLRQLELGLTEAAARTLLAEHGRWNADLNMLRGTPYAGDKALQAELRRTNPDFQDRLIYEALLYWPARRRLIILERLGSVLELSPKLLGLKFLSLPADTPAGRAAVKALAAGPGVMEAVDPAALDAAAARLAEAALPLKAGAFSRSAGAGAAALALLEEREPALLLAGRNRGRRYSPAELKLLAAAAGGDKAKASELAAARPADPLCLGLAGAAVQAGANPGLLLDAAEIYQGLGRKDKAAGLAAAAAALADGPDQLRRAALTLQAAGRYPQALEAVSRAAAAAPGDAAVQNDRGVLLMLLGRGAEAEKVFTQAMEKNWQAGMNLAALKSRAGDKAGADKIYRALLAGGGLPPDVRLALERGLKK